MVYIDFYISFTMFADYRDLITCCSLSATLTPKCSCVAVYVIECSCILILLILPAICTPYPYTLHSSSESHICAGAASVIVPHVMRLYSVPLLTFTRDCFCLHSDRLLIIYNKDSILHYKIKFLFCHIKYSSYFVI